MLLAASIFIKLATVVIIPVYFVLLFLQLNRHYWHKEIPLNFVQLVHKTWPVVVGFLFFYLLFTERSKQFLPWYLTWVLVWLPFFTQVVDKKIAFMLTGWKISIILLSITALLRYLPFLWFDLYSDAILGVQKNFVWAPVSLFYLIWGIAALGFNTVTLTWIKSFFSTRQ